MSNNNIAKPITTWQALWESDREILHRSEVAQLLGLDARTVSAAVESGDLPGTHIGRRLLIPRRPLLQKLSFDAYARRARPSAKRRPNGALAASTVLRYSGWVITIFNAAVEAGLIERNPAAHKNAGCPRGPRAKRVRPFQVWDAEQAAMFCAWALDTDQPWAHAWAVET